MSRKTTRLLKAALTAMHASRAGDVLAPLTAGNGVIFTLHHVRPEPPAAFEPNRILKITPEFLEAVIRQVIEQGFEVISLDEVPARLARGGTGRPFACFTFDDGYRDNRDYALPIFRKYGLPFTIFIPTSYPDRRGHLWWLGLEEIVRRAQSLRIDTSGAPREYATDTLARKEQAFHEIYWMLRKLPERQARAIVADLSRELGIDLNAMTDDLIMTWDEIRDVAKDPLVSFGAHTRGHLALAKLGEQEARDEIMGSIQRLEQEVGRPCRHFSYPYGDESSAGEREYRLVREAGMATAVTTCKGLIHAHHKDALTALPRVSLNGDYQDIRFVKVLLSGAPFAFRDAVKRLRQRALGYGRASAKAAAST